MVIKIPRFQRIDGGSERYEAITDDGARLVVVYDARFDSFFWRVERQDRGSVAGSAPDAREAKERAISAWIATR